MPPVDDPVLFGPCAVVRWLRILKISVTKFVTAVIADLLDEAKEVTSTSPHLCRSTRPLDPKTLAVPVLAPINQWGALPDRHSSLSTHGQSRRARDLLAGNIGIHRDIPVSRREPPPEGEVPAATRTAVYDEVVADRASAKRRGDLAQLGDVAGVLTDIDRKIADLQQRVTAHWIPKQTDPSPRAGEGQQLPDVGV